tara:strand:+ start:2361 stop:2663 length:303 start_codon:yes stop_codon:yes gene_type:complete
MEKTPFKMKGYSYAGKSPMKDNEEFPGLLPEVTVSGGKKTVPGSFIQDERGSSVAGSSVEHAKLRKKQKNRDKNLTSSEQARLKILNTKTEKAYWEHKKN